jgi:hypothetical protein
MDTKLAKIIRHLYIYFQEKAEVIQDTLWVRLGVH